MKECCDTCIHKKVCDYWEKEARPDEYGTYDGEPCMDYFPVDVAPVVYGEWIKQEQEYPMMGCKVIVGYKCSVCDGKQELKTNYCCDCGARMDGGK